MSAYDSGEVSVATQAKAWVDAVNSGTGPSGGWRLQLVRMRTRRRFGKPLCGEDASTLPEPGGVTDANGEPAASVEHESDAGECPEAPVRIRRFVSGCPWALVDRAIRYLHRIAPYRGIVYNGVRLSGAYRPTITQWMRDEQSQSPGERGSLGTYTLVQDLVEITCCGDEETLGTGDSCQSREETTYVWDADSVEPLPTSCEQGVTYALRAVQRDEEGNFSYQLVRSVAKTVAWGPVTVACGPLETVEEWGWRNLYGCPPASGQRAEDTFRVESCGDRCGASMGLGTIPAPGVCDAEGGVRTEAQWQLNQDCTWDVRVRRRTAKPEDGAWEDGTSCRPASHVVYRNSPDVPYVPPPAPGERVSANFRMNDDLTWDGEVSMVSAPGPDHWDWEEGSACRRRSVEVYEDQVVRPEPPPLASLAPGETLEASLSKTEDCLWNARFAVTAAPSADHMHWTEGSSCQQVDAHRLVNQASYEGVVPAPSAGERVSADVSRNPDCTYDVSYRVQKPYEGGVDLAWDDGPQCRRTHHTLIVGAGEKPSAPALSAGQTLSMNLRFDPSDCTWSGEQAVTDPERAECMEWAEGSCLRPREAHLCVGQDTYDMVPEPDGDKSVDADVKRNPDCTYDVRFTVTRAQPRDTGWLTWDSETVTKSGTMKYHHGFRAFYNLDSVPVPDRGADVLIDARLNEFCKYDGQLSYKDLYEWTDSDGGGGGIRSRTTSEVVRVGEVYDPKTRRTWYAWATRTDETRVFLGSGNEGSEAEFVLDGARAVGPRQYRKTSYSDYEYLMNRSAKPRGA